MILKIKLNFKNIISTLLRKIYSHYSSHSNRAYRKEVRCVAYEAGRLGEAGEVCAAGDGGLDPLEDRVQRRQVQRHPTQLTTFSKLQFSRTHRSIGLKLLSIKVALAKKLAPQPTIKDNYKRNCQRRTQIFLWLYLMFCGRRCNLKS
jgi:hypothetical protein